MFVANRIKLAGTLAIITLLTLQRLQSLSFVAEKIMAVAPTKRNKVEKLFRKDWTLLVYMPVNSSTSKYAIENLKQMIAMGSTNSMHIVTQIDKQGEDNIERVYIQKNKALLLELNPQSPENMPGTAQSLYSFIEWGVTNFPSDKVALLTYNTGSGIKDMNLLDKFLITHRDSIYQTSPKNGRLEINYQLETNFNLMKKIEKNYSKLLEFDLSRASSSEVNPKDIFHISMSNQDLKSVLEKTRSNLLSNKKIDLVFMDTCHMAMAEIAYQMKNSVKILVASQEFAPEKGHNYELLLAPFLNGTLSPEDFAKTAVATFDKECSSKYAQYTLSAIDLEHINSIEEFVAKLTDKLLKVIDLEKEMFIDGIKSIRCSEKFTTEFYDADYIDLCHFCNSLSFLIDELAKPKRNFVPSEEYTKSLEDLNNLAKSHENIAKKVILKSTNCKYQKNAHGISIYFPKRKIQEAYYATDFDQKTNWSLFLNVYIQEAKKIKDSKTFQLLEKRAIELEEREARKKTAAKNKKTAEKKGAKLPPVKTATSKPAPAKQSTNKTTPAKQTTKPTLVKAIPVKQATVKTAPVKPAPAKQAAKQTAKPSPAKTAPTKTATNKKSAQAAKINTRAPKIDSKKVAHG